MLLSRSTSLEKYAKQTIELNIYRLLYLAHDNLHSHSFIKDVPGFMVGTYLPVTILTESIELHGLIILHLNT